MMNNQVLVFTVTLLERGISQFKNLAQQSLDYIPHNADK